MSESPACPRCEYDDETVLHALVRFPKISGLIVYAEHVLLHLGRVDKCMIKITPPPGLSKKGVECLLCTNANLKERIWKTRMKVVAMGTFISGLGLLLYYFRCHPKSKIGLERGHLSRSMYEKRCKNVARKLGMNDPV